MSIFTPRNRKSTTDPDSGAFVPNDYNSPRPIMASAVRLNMRNKKEHEQLVERKKNDQWQQEAWEYFDLIGEIKFSASMIANVLSRINLYAAFVEDSSMVPSNIKGLETLDEDFRKAVIEILYSLESSNGGTSGILRNMALNLFVVGECYLVREKGDVLIGEPDHWTIRSIDEFGTLNKRFIIKPRRNSPATDFIKLPMDTVATRIWRNHPRFSDEADSSLRGLLELCDELLLLSRSSRATSRSRLNSGMMFVPDGLSVSAQFDGDMEEMADGAADASDDFIEELIDSMITPIRDESDASSVAPFVVRGEKDLGEKIKLFSFNRSFDQMHVQMAENKLDRILAGLDIPKDIAQGLSGVKYSNAILIEESLYKAHIEPLILMIVDALSVGVLRPLLREMGYDGSDVNRAVIWYDPSAITAKPSKSEAATQGYEMGVVSADAWLRYNGFAPTDAPDELESAQRFAKDKGVLSEGLTEMMMNTIIPADILAKYRQQSIAMSDPESGAALEDALGNGAPAEELPTQAVEPTEPVPPGLIDP